MMNLIMNLVDAYLVIGVAVGIAYFLIGPHYNDVVERNEGESGRQGTLESLFYAVVVGVLWPWMIVLMSTVIMPFITKKYGQSIYEDVENGEFKSEEEGG